MRWLLVVLVAGSLAVLAPLTADAQKGKGDKKDEKSADEARSDIVSDMMTAYRLVESGRKEKAPEMLITAAGMLRALAKVPLGDITEEVTVENDKGEKTTGPAKSDAKAPDLTEEANALFDEAETMGLNLKLQLGGLIKLAKERPVPPRYRAVDGGPRTISRKIGRGQTQVFNFHFHCATHCAIGFRSSFPMRIQAVRDDIGQIWIDALTDGGMHRGVPGGNPGQKCRVTIRIYNGAPTGGQFQLFVS
jgi:hypothetical protein